MSLTRGQELMLKLGEIYDQKGELCREDAMAACEPSELLLFYQIEQKEDIVFNCDTGKLDYMPSDSQILNPLSS